MKKLVISGGEAGGRLDRYLKARFPGAPQGFLYKMLRKKNITLNGRKADPSAILSAGDEICLYLSDETAEKFHITETAADSPKAVEERQAPPLSGFCTIVYEDGQILLADKKPGVLSQQARAGEYTLNEALLDYVRRCKAASYEGFSPSVMNRLDRNTSGLVTFAKTPACARALSALFRTREAGKYYLAAVHGTVPGPASFSAWLIKDEANNTVRISNVPVSGGDRIETSFEPLASCDGRTLLKVRLLTGKTHQIRAHLSFLGYPVIGDPKYGDRAADRRLLSLYKIRSQLLHSYELCFPEQCAEPLSHLSGKVFRTAVPPVFQKLFPVIKL